MSARALAALLVLACSACNVGQPLVDKTEPQFDKVLACPMPPSCEAELTLMEPPDHPAKPIAGCASPTLCQFGDAALGLGGCSADLPLDTLPPTANCRRLKLEAKADDNALSLHNVAWSEVDLDLRADKPLTLTMSGGTIEHLYVALHGPIAVRIEHMQKLVDLRLEAEADAVSGGAPSVSLDDMYGETLSIGAADEAFPGSVTVHALQLKDVDLRAQGIVIESANIDGAKLRADTINVTDLSLTHAEVEAGNALWSSYSVQDSFLKFCGDARLVDGDFSSIRLSSCLDSPLRVYMSHINSSSIDGNFELDQDSVNNSRLGMNEQTRVLAFDTGFTSTRVCEAVELFALGHTSELRCSDCADPTAEQPFCMLKSDPEEESDPNAFDDRSPFQKNYCKVWEELDPLPDCADDLPTHPERRR